MRECVFLVGQTWWMDLSAYTGVGSCGLRYHAKWADKPSFTWHPTHSFSRVSFNHLTGSFFQSTEANSNTVYFYICISLMFRACVKKLLNSISRRLIKKHGRLARWLKWRACDAGEAKERLENELWRRWSDGKVGEWALHLRQSSFSNPSVCSPTSQFIFQPFFRFSYVISSSLNSPGGAPIHISYVSYKIFVKYCGRHWQKQGSDWLSQVQFFIPFCCQIPPS